MTDKTSTTPDQQSAALALVGQAREALAARQLDQTDSLTLQALEIAPDCVPAIELRGVVASIRGDHAASVEAFARVTAHQPENPGAWFNLGKCRFDAGDREAAIRDLEKALKLDSSLLDAQVLMALAQRDSGQTEQAEATLDDVLSKAPRHLAAVSALATLAARSGDYERAIPLFRRAIEIEPGVPQTHFNLGEALLRDDQLTAASEALHHALTLDHQYHPARLALAEVAVARQDLDEAIGLCRRVVRRRPRDLGANFMLMRLLLAQGRLGEFETSLGQAAEHLSASPFYTFWQAQLDARRGRIEEARATLEQLLHSAKPPLDAQFINAELALLGPTADPAAATE